MKPLAATLRRLLPMEWVSRLRYATPAPGEVRFGDLRRLQPICRYFGYSRGLPIDRHYIERFLQAHAGDVRGDVLEVGDDSYTRKFGGNRVIQSHVLHVPPGTPQATIIADLASADTIPSSRFDCIILTQTLHLIFDVPAAIHTLHRILRPNGVLLLTVPGITKIDPYGEWRDSWYWSFTTHSARRLFSRVFPSGSVEVNAYGNVLTAIAFLHGLTAAEMRSSELDYRDPDYELLVTVRAVR